MVKPEQRGSKTMDRTPVHGQENPYLFIVGCPRSGTTLMQRMVDAHPLIAVTPETHWIPRFIQQRIGVSADGMATSELVPALLEYYRFALLNIPREQVEELAGSGEPISYARFVTGIFNLYGQARGKPLVGDKTPGYVRFLPTLHELWPQARLVHLIRDGRDVCLSLLNWEKADRILGRYPTWTQDRVTTAALFWERHVRSGRKAPVSREPDLYCEIRYESLVACPEEECLRLCAFLGVSFDEAMLRFHVGRTREEPGLSAKHAWLPVTRGLRDWRTQMPPEDVERFEAAAGDLLAELGYQRAYPTLRPEAIAHAAQIRDQFTADARARKRVMDNCGYGPGSGAATATTAASLRPPADRAHPCR
jgi:hypothetical protein